MTTTSQVCTFRVGDDVFGLEVSRIQEVMRDHDLTPVPRAPPALRGLINLRGQIVTAFDMRTVLGLPPATRHAMNLIVHRAHGISSLLVDRIADVIEVEEAWFERPPMTVSRRARQLIRGAYKLPTQFILALDLDAVLRAASARKTDSGES
jgi:purine-binding chemotaxis protein CheW